MYKKIWILLLILTGMTCLIAINSIKGNGEKVSHGTKDIEAAYHNSTSDLLLYGTTSWGVLYDFKNWYDSLDSLSFTIRSASVYIEALNNNLANVEVGLYSNVSNQPGGQITTKIMSFHQGWNEIVFDNVFTMQQVWLIVSINNQGSNLNYYMPASFGNGSHSYFKQNNAYYKFSNYGFDAELLFSLKGNFNFASDTYDLELKDFKFTEVVIPDSEVKPEITIRNNCNKEINNVYLINSYNNPNSSVNVRDSIFVTDRLLAEEELTLSEDLIPAIHFPEFPSQYQFTSTVYCAQSENELTDNNYKSLTLNVFPDLQEKIVIENFLQSYHTPAQNMWNAQTALIDENKAFRLDYFPEMSDPLNNNVAVMKNQYYNNFSYPNTLIQGNNKIFGYLSDYPSSFTDTYNKALSSRTFLTFNQIAVEDNEYDLGISFQAENTATRIFSDYLKKCRIRLYLVQPYSHNLFHGYMLTNNITDFLTGIELGCDFGQSQSDTLYIVKDEINLLGDNKLKDCLLMIQVQHSTTKEILFTGWYSMPDIELNQGTVVVPTQDNAVVYPNPVRANGSLSIKSINDGQKQIDIYNIKGQKIQDFKASTKEISWNLKNYCNKSVPSGVYFIRIAEMQTGKKTLKKVMVIK